MKVLKTRMISAKPEVMAMFGKWRFDKTGLMINGAKSIGHHP